MTTVADVDLRGWSIQASSPFLDGRYPISSRPAGQLGTNLEKIDDWMASQPFVDLMKITRLLIANDSAIGNVDESHLIQVDADGWATTLTNTGTFDRVSYFWALDANYAYAGQQHVVTWDGEGTLAWTGAGFGFVSGVANRHIVTVGTGGHYFYIDSINDADPIRNIRIVPLTEEFNTNLFRQDFIDSLSAHSTLRFMDWAETNNNTHGTWAERPTETFFRQSQDIGASLEVMIALCNATGKDMWYCFPHLADDNYVNQAAALILATLDPTLNLYVEYSNEVWNWGFGGQANYCEAQGLAKYGQAGGKLSWYGFRSNEIAGMVKTVWGASSARVFGVMAGQAAQTSTITAALECTLEGGGAGACSTNIDAISSAPYFTFNAESGQEAALLAGGATGIIDTLTNTALPQSIGWMQNWKVVADSYSMPHVAYEGGQHVAAFGTAQDDQAVLDLLLEVSRDARMNPLYDAYLDAWRTESGNELFTHYTNSFPVSSLRFGTWGANEGLGLPISPKQQALEDF